MFLVFSFGIVHSPFLVFSFQFVNRNAPPRVATTRTTLCKKNIHSFLIKNFKKN